MDSKQQVKYFQVTASLADLKGEGIYEDIRGKIGEVDAKGFYWDGYILLKINPNDKVKEALGDKAKGKYFDIPKSFTVEIKKEEL